MLTVGAPESAANWLFLGMRNTWSKGERLSSRKEIAALFVDGESVSSYPIKIIYRSSDQNSPFPCQVSVAVPKHRWKKAVDRNEIKRQIREAFRKNKQEFYAALERAGKHYSMMILYTGKEKVSGTAIEEKIIALLGRLTVSNEAHIG